MPDFMPEDIEDYVRRAERVDNVMSVMNDEEVDEAIDLLGEALERVATKLSNNEIPNQQVVSAVVGIAAALMAEWYAVEEYGVEEDEDE